MPWASAITCVADRKDYPASESGNYDGYFYTTVLHSDFDPEWPITTDWPSVVRGLRGSFGLSQAAFATMCGIGRATVERWEAGRMVPFGGDTLTLLTQVGPRLESAIQAGQALNLAAAVVLPHLTRPTAEYQGRDLVAFLNDGKHDHRYLGRGLLNALVASRILVPLHFEDDELDDSYFPLAARLRDPVGLPEWAPGLIDDLLAARESDRALVLELAARLGRGN